MNITTDQVIRFLKDQFKTGDVVVKLIFIQLFIYISLKLVGFVEWVLKLDQHPIQGFISEWLFLPSSAKELLIKPYTLLSYQFIHDSFWHVLVNVMLLFFFGKMIVSLQGFKKVLPIYILGGFFGGLVFVLFHSLELVPMMSTPMLGASASIMALMGAAAFLQPDYTVKFFLIFDVKLKWLVAGFGLLNLLGLSNAEGAGPGIIHVAGLIFGLAIVFLETKGIQLSKPFNMMVNSILSLFNPKPKPRVTFVNPNPVKKKKDSSTAGVKAQDKIDAILDKISSDGYDSLSKAEKDFLFQASKKS